MDRNEVVIDTVYAVPFARGICFEYTGNIGFGTYTLYRNKEQWYADSEHMDTTEDKWFLKLLIDKFISQVTVTP